MIPIVVLAMIAGFLALRLYSVLGKRSGHEQPLVPVEDRSPPAVTTVGEDSRPGPVPITNSVFTPGASAGIRAIIGADPSFDVARFIDGAKGAYGLILEAYWRADTAALDGLTSDEVRHAFADSIATRSTAGHVLDNRLVTIEQATITGAELSGKTARVTVRFEADIAAGHARWRRDGNFRVVDRRGSHRRCMDVHASRPQRRSQLDFGPTPTRSA